MPDWVCEITSPSTVQHDRVTKRRLYAQHGVRHDWLVDPETRLLEALELRDGQWVELGVYDDTAVVRIAPFEAIELAVVGSSRRRKCPSSRDRLVSVDVARRDPSSSPCA